MCCRVPWGRYAKRLLTIVEQADWAPPAWMQLSDDAVAAVRLMFRLWADALNGAQLPPLAAAHWRPVQRLWVQ